jgi:hypothetical protein
VVKKNKIGENPKFERKDICHLCSKFSNVEYYDNVCEKCWELPVSDDSGVDSYVDKINYYGSE